MSSPVLGLVFPGQGSQSVGMLAALAQRWPELRTSFDEASQGARMDLWALVSEGPEALLNQTRNTQPVLLAASVAVYRLWRSVGGAEPVVMAGHSLGEYSALVCAGAISLHDAAGLVAERGRLMQEAVPEGVGAMAAVLGGDDAQIARICREEAGEQVVAPANYNAAGQVVIAGHAEAVDRVLQRLREQGLKRSVRLPVSVPSHCWLMREAAERLAEAIGNLRMSLPRVPVVQNADARSFDSADAIRDALVRQLYQPVRWTDCVRELAARGATLLIECGPGKVLTGLARRIDGAPPCLPTETPELFEAALAAAGGSQ